VDPHLDADVTLGGLGLGEPVVNLGAKRGERDGAQLGTFGPAHFRATKTTGEQDLNAPGTAVHGLLQRPLDRAAKAGPLLELLGDVLADQLGVDFRPGDLFNLDIDPASGERLQLFLDPLDFRPLATDDHARAGGEEDDLHGVAGAFDLDLGDAGERVLFLDELADLEVFDQEVAEFMLVGVPTTAPVLVNADAESGGMGLLAHE